MVSKYGHLMLPSGTFSDKVSPDIDFPDIPPNFDVNTYGMGTLHTTVSGAVLCIVLLFLIS